MNLSTMLQARAEAGRSVRVGLIGAGKFGSMFLSQGVRTPGMHIVGIADLNLSHAREATLRVGWTPERTAYRSIDAAIRSGGTCILEDAGALIASDLDVIVDATGSPAASIRMPCCAASTASTSSWSTSRRTPWRARYSPARRRRPASSTPSPTATSRP